jgi:hypothetical protein
MSHNPPTYSHSIDPLDADDWLKTITKKLEIVQCTNREMVLYVAGRLVGQAGDWWDAYATAHPNRHNITWQEFRDNFHTYHIPSGVIKLKQKGFLALRQGSMSVTEYLDKFTHLSRYAPDEVNTDLKRQERFLDGLNKTIGLESKRKELDKKKHKFQSHGQSSSNTRPHYSPQQSPSHYCPSGQGGRYPQNLQLQRSFQPQRFNPQTPGTPTPQ